eukprot:7501107-Pyramimonas_sp.AAC.1
MWCRSKRSWTAPAMHKGVLFMSLLLPEVCQALTSSGWVLQSSDDDTQQYLISELTFYSDTACTADLVSKSDSFIYDSEGCTGPKLTTIPLVLQDGVCAVETGRSCAKTEQDFQSCDDEENEHRHYIGWNFTEEVEVKCARICQPKSCGTVVTFEWCAYAWDPSQGDVGGWSYQGMAIFNPTVSNTAVIDATAAAKCDT